MSWRVWLFRSLVCVGLAAAGTVGWLVYLQTNSNAVRAKVVEQIRHDFPGVEVQIGSAWIRPLGGLWLHDVRLYRRDDPTHPFLVIPSATIYHDKEQMAQGRLVVRKVELLRPEIRLRRDADGNWNLPALPPRAGKPSGEPRPMLVVRQGTLHYEDRSRGQTRPVLELADIQLTMVNDPLARMSLSGQGLSPLGALHWSGDYDLSRNLFALTLELPAYTLTPRVVEQIGGHVPEVRQHLAGLEGQGDATLKLRYEPGSGTGVRPDLRVRLSRGRFGHPRLPLSPLEEIELTARYREGALTIEKGRARSGPTRITLDLEAALPLEGPHAQDPEQFVTRFNVAIEHLSLSGELFDRLPDDLKQIHKDFKPFGPVGLTFRFERRERWWSKSCIVEPEGLTAEYREFPYVLRSLRGKLEQVTTSDGRDELKVDLTGLAEGHPIFIEGSTARIGDQERIDVKIRGNGVPVDENLKQALGRNRGAVEAFHAAGSGDFVARVSMRPGDTHSEIHVEIDFRQISVCHDAFPYALENVSGTLRVHVGTETKITFDQFQGHHAGGEVTLDGTDLMTPSGSVLRMKVRAAALPFDSALATAFGRVSLGPLLKTMRPSGRLGFNGEIAITEWNAPPNARKPPSRLELLCHQFQVDAVLPEFLPYELTAVSGSFHFAEDRLTLYEFKARHRGSRLSACSREQPGVFILKPGGGLWARLRQIQLAPLVPDEELLCALPSQMRSVCAALQASGPMSLTANEFIIDTTADPPGPVGRDVAGRNRETGGARMSSAALREEGPTPWMYWNTLNIRLSGASLKLGLRCDNVHGVMSVSGEYRHGRLGAVEGNLIVDQANVHRQPVQDVHAHLVMDPAKAPGILQVKNLKGRLFGGQIAGEVAVMLEPVLRYDLSVKAVGVRMEEVARHNRLGPDAQLSGAAEAHVYLAGQGSDLSTLRGGGTMRVPKGRIYNLPPLLDLLKFIKLQAPDGTAFEEAYTRFGIQGETVHFEQIDLLGNLISLTGQGEMKLDGTQLKLDVYTVWSRLVQLLPGAGHEVPGAISRGLFKIEMRGELGGKLEFQKEALPAIVDPLRRLMDRMAATR